MDFDPARVTAWTAEGLLPYLSNDDAARLLTGVGGLSAPGSRLAFEYDEFADDSTLSKLRGTAGMEEVASMWAGGLQDDAIQWMRARDWDVTRIERPMFAESCGRPLADTTGAFLIATRQAGN